MPELINLVTRSCNGGKGTFTRRKIPTNTRILEFTGDRVFREIVNQALAEGGHDSFLQVGEDAFIGSSGDMDDYVNHSCDPNCGLEFAGARIYLRSIKPIKRGEQLTFDYATSQKSFPFRFHCRCGSQDCRGEIGDYSEIPDYRKIYYHSMGIIAPYLMQPAEIVRKRTRTRRLNPRKSDFSLTPAYAPEQ